MGQAVDRKKAKRSSSTGNRTRVSRVRAVYPNQLDYRGLLHVYRKLISINGLPRGPHTRVHEPRREVSDREDF